MLQSSSTSEEEQYFPEYGSLGMREISVLPDLWVDLYVIKHELSPAPHLYAENFLDMTLWFRMDYKSKKMISRESNQDVNY